MAGFGRSQVAGKVKHIEMNEKYQHDYPNSHYLSNLNNLNGTNQTISLNRLPTLGEILSNKTKLPVDLFTFYKFMKDIENRVEYLDFWFDLVNHLNLCKYYVQGLRSSLIKNQNINRDLNLLENHKSLSSSVLLDMIINDDILQDNDSNRLSQFLRGDVNVSDPKLVDLINQYESDSNRNLNMDLQRDSTRHSKLGKYEGMRPPSALSEREKRVSSQSKLIEQERDDEVENKVDPEVNVSGYSPVKRNSINPNLLENLIRDSPRHSTNSFITRSNLKESTHNLLLKYFVEDLEKNLNLPSHLNDHIIKSIEINGRDDPDIFNNVKSYIFTKIENEHLPNFLNFIAIKNLNSNFLRILIGLFFLFIGLWISFVLIFLDYRKAVRVPVLVPYLIGFYLIVSSIYLIDPIMVWLKRSQSFDSHKLLKIEEPFIFKLLLKRSLWVTFLILLGTAVLTLIFCLVPGHRL